TPHATELAPLPEDDDPAHEGEYSRHRQDDDGRERVEKQREVRRCHLQHRDHRATSCAMCRYVRPSPSSIVTPHCQPSDFSLSVAMHECCTSPGRAGAYFVSTVRPDTFISSLASSFTLVSVLVPTLNAYTSSASAPCGSGSVRSIASSGAVATR